MKIMIELPEPHYRQLREKLARGSKEFILLTNACVETKEIGDRSVSMVQIVCQKSEAEHLFDVAIKLDPIAARTIRDSLEMLLHNPGGLELRIRKLSPRLLRRARYPRKQPRITTVR